MTEQKIPSRLFEEFQKKWAVEQEQVNQAKSLTGMMKKAEQTGSSNDRRHAKGAKKALRRR